jgi:predicted nucleotidyltransferase
MRGSSLKLVESVAERLGSELRAEVAFLGGATIELLLTDPAVDEVRVTKDVDLITAGRSRVSFLVGLAERLRARGFREGGEGAYRWKIGDLVVDVMPIEADILGFSNRWYPEALANARPYTLPSGTEIRLVTAPYVLATKMEAFLGRGGGDFLMSHDLGDIIALVDGREELVEEVGAESQELRQYVRKQLAEWLANDRFALLAVPGHLPFEGGRAEIVLERLRAIAQQRHDH